MSEKAVFDRVQVTAGVRFSSLLVHGRSIKLLMNMSFLLMVPMGFTRQQVGSYTKQHDCSVEKGWPRGTIQNTT